MKRTKIDGYSPNKRSSIIMTTNKKSHQEITETKRQSTHNK